MLCSSIALYDFQKDCKMAWNLRKTGGGEEVVENKRKRCGGEREYMWNLSHNNLFNGILPASLINYPVILIIIIIIIYFRCNVDSSLCGLLLDVCMHVLLYVSIISKSSMIGINVGRSVFCPHQYVLLPSSIILYLWASNKI